MITPTARNGLWSHHTHTTSRLVSTDLLNPATFAPFGSVIQNPTTHHGTPELDSVKANQGSATKWLDVTHLRDFYRFSESGKAAQVAFNMFVCEPREMVVREGGTVFPVKILERHPFTAQTFIPLGVSSDDENVRYLVIVAPTLPSNISANDSQSTVKSDASNYTTDPPGKGFGRPDLDNIKAFIAKGDQAVTYSAGTWHAPMVVLGKKAIDFVVVQYANGVALEDCQETELVADDGGSGLGIDVGDSGKVRAKL